ncbi:MATE family efflux transporter [Novosphingobium sp. M1R2S20]|uniref:Multidrug-efflux transporter n=1 Tax=Novosphingobium rhizovicinum TaxID=3228928 RepID=A0ABV3RAP6_9SPHN
MTAPAPLTQRAPRLFRDELSATLRLSVPLAAANILQMAVFATDVMFVSRLGQEALAASSLAVAIFGLMLMGFFGLTGAVAPLIAAEIGRRRHAVREVRRSVRMALWLCGLLGVIGIAVCLTGETIILATGQQPVLARRAAEFLEVCALSVIPMLVINVLRTFVSAMGRPFFATLITGASIAVNAFGNWVLVFGNLGVPPLGLLGSPLASFLTACVTVLAYCIAIRSDRHLRRMHIFGRWWRPEWSRLQQIVALGVPIAATLLAEGGLFSSAAFLMGLIGEAQLAAHTVALQIASIFFQIPFGIGQAATIRVGYHFGAKNREAIGRAGWAALVIGLAFVGFSAGAMLVFPALIVSAYVDIEAPANAALLAFAVQYLLVAAAFQLVDGAQAVAAGVLRGMQDTRIPMVIAIISYWAVGFVVAYALGLHTPLSGIGVWIGLAVGLTVAAALLLLRWIRRDRLGLLPTPALA